MSNEQRGQEEDREYELTDLFGDEIRPQDQNMNPELERVRSAAARKAYDHSPVEGSPRAGGFPGAEQFKASAEEMGTRMPGIHLTSVEEEYRLAHPQTGDDTTGFIPEQPVPVTAVPVPQAQISPTEPVQVPRQSAEPEPREYATAYHGKYDYDYDAEETGYVSGSPEKQVSSPDMDPENTLQLQLAQALEQERRASRALEQKEEAQRLAREKKERTQRGLIIGIMGILALILVGAIIMILLPSGEDVLPVESSSTSSAVVRDQKTFSGIVTRVDREHGTMLVYNAEERNEKSFSTMDTTISLDDLEVGDMIDVVYDAASRDVLISIMSCAKAEKVEGITGIPVEGSTLSISQSSYTLDERLICTYNGSSYSKEKINASTVFCATVMEGHCYRIEVTSVSVSLTLENLGQYSGASVLITPSGEEAVEKTATTDALTLEVPEGSVDVSVNLEGKEVYKVRVFASAGSDNVIRIPDKNRQTGTVVFLVEGNVDAEVTVSIDGQEYMTGTGITMEYGSYNGTAKAEGYKERTLMFSLEGAYKVVKIQLDEAKAPVTINANVNGFTVWVDGAYATQTANAQALVLLKEGVHWIVCTKDGYYEQTISVVVDSSVAAQSVTLDGFVELPPEESSSESESSSEASEGSSGSGESSSESGSSSGTTESSSESGESSSQAESTPE